MWDPRELRPELVGDLVADADDLAGRSPSPMAVITIIEAVEQLFLHDKPPQLRAVSDQSVSYPQALK